MPQDQININSITSALIASPHILLATKVNREIKSAIMQMQEKVQIEAKENNEIWERITKAVNVAIVIETPSQID